MYSRVRETIDSLGSTVYEFSIPGVFPQTEKYEWKATKSRIARKSGADCDCDHYRNGYFAYPFPPATNFGYRRGFLRGVYQYSRAGMLVRKREMTALQLSDSSAMTIKGIKFEKIDTSHFYYGIYEILVGRGQVVASETATEYSDTDSIPMVVSTHYHYNSNNILDQIIDTLADGSTRTKKIRYARDYVFTSAPASSDTAAVALKALNDGHRYGELIEQTTRVTPIGDTTVLTDANLIVYRVVNGRPLPYYIKTVPSGVDVAESSLSGGNTFEEDTNYYTVRTFKEYDSESRPIFEFDKNKNKVNHSYAIGYGYEAATFANIKSHQAVSEGFETALTAGLSVSAGTPSYSSPGWTGDFALDLTSSITLTSESLSKEATDKYRLSCWAKAGSATTIYFKAYSGTTSDIGSLAIDASNQWKYYEEVVSANSLPSSFELRVTSNGNVTIDDIVFSPAEARLALQTVEPMVGITSSTDDRGNSVKVAYDAQGRKVGVFDRKRNLVQKIEYDVQKQLVPELVAGFTTDASYFLTNSAVTFKALDLCNIEGASYSWTVDGSVESTIDSLTKTFSIPGQHNISLAVTKDGVTKSFDQDICVALGGSPGITATDGEDAYLPGFTADCNTPEITFTANDVPSSGGGYTVTISWQAVSYTWTGQYPIVTVVEEFGTGTSVSFSPHLGAITVQAVVEISSTSAVEFGCLGDAHSYFILGFDINWNSGTCN